MSFASGIAGYAKRTNLSIDNSVTQICATASDLIIRKTPADTGRARGNWFATIGTASSETSETRRANDATMDALATAKIASGKVFYLTNNLDYIRKLEYGLFPWANSTKVINHFSTQAPAGFFRLSIAEIQNSLKGFK